MKKLFVLILSLLLLISLLSFASCDQESVDNTRSELLDKTSDVLEPFFKEASSTDNSFVDDEKTDTSSEDLGNTPDIKQ